MSRLGVFISLAALTAALAGCGDESEPDDPDSVAVRGAVYSDHKMDQPCEAQSKNQMRPDALAGIEMTFTSTDGAVLGSTVTGPLEWQDLEEFWQARRGDG